MSDLLIEIEELMNRGLTAEEIALKLNLGIQFVETAIELLEQDCI